MSYNCCVIGAGLAGLTAALRLAEAGLRVAVVAKGVGSLHLGGATIDVLGYAGGLVAEPAAALGAFAEEHPEHPYARLTRAEIAEALDWLRDRAAPVTLVGSLEENFLLPSAVGVPRPAAVVPETMVAGDLRAGGRFVLVGFRTLKDFYPGYAAANLERAKLPSKARVEARAVEVPAGPGDDADLPPQRLARLFDQPSWREKVVREVERHIERGESIGFPAVLGLRDSPAVWHELQEVLGAPVFEIPTLPPSIPGLRLSKSLHDALRAAGGRVVTGTPVVDAAIASSGRRRRIGSVAAATGARPQNYAAEQFVLASGGVAAGGIDMDSSWRLRETVFGLPLAGVPGADQERFSSDYFGAHPAARAGVAVDDQWRPVDNQGGVVFDNLRVAGAALYGAEPWKEKSGNGLSLATGYWAATAILEARD